MTAPDPLKLYFTDVIGYEERRPNINRQVETASLTVPFILSFGDRFEIGLGHKPTRDDAVPSFVAGLGTRPVFIQSNGRAKCLQINFTPIGAHLFFQLPMDELADRMVPAADVADAGLATFIRTMEDTDCWPGRLRRAAVYVSRRIRERQTGQAPAVHVYRRLLANDGRISIATLAAEVGWSRKHLAHKFRQEIGLAPKTVARIARFGRARSLASAGNEINWADLALECGFADQAHLIREFSEFAGRSPAAWLALFRSGQPTTW